MLMRVVGMPTCREMAESLTGALEDGLTTRDRRRAAMHLTVCGNCRRFRRQLDLTREAVVRLPVPPVPPDAKAQLPQSFRRRDDR
jgi:hypothetical protein